MKQVALAEAVSTHVRPGDTVHVMMGHSRWTAAARELLRQSWGSSPELVLVMASLSSLGALFFKGGLVRKVITAYSGDAFPTYSPNPVFQRGYTSGEVEVEHWSFLSFAQRLEAGARGLPAMVTGSLAGSSMSANPGFSLVETPFGTVGLVQPLVPDVTLLHAALADEQGNLVMSEPLLEGVWGAWAARRGVIATVEKVVSSLEGLGHRVRVPAHRVLAVVEAPLGAHPGGCFAPGLPVNSYGEDIPFWVDSARATRADLESWARHWVLEPKDQGDYLARLGDDRIEGLIARADPNSWKAEAESIPVPVHEPPSSWEIAAALGAREVVAAVEELDADAVLAGAGVANLAAWVAVGRARAGGSKVVLTAELGLWDYTPTPADPYVFNQRVFPATTYLTDASGVLGLIVGGPGTTTIGCLGAAQVDRHGNLNSTQLSVDHFLVGSGGGSDVASRANTCVVVTLARSGRLPADVSYVTSPGARVSRIVTDAGILRRNGSDFEISAVLAGAGSLAERVAVLKGACGWDVPVARNLEELVAVSASEVAQLRNFDRLRLFLS